VVMDYRLGTTTGLDLHGRMKAAGFDVPVIIVSGSMDDRMVIEAIRAGVRDVIVKSTDYLDYLPDAVRAVLRQTAAVADRRPQEQRNATVLVVEDDEGVATLERRRLERAGYNVEVAATPDQALAVVTRGGVSVAVLDLRLPDGASGIDLYEQMKTAGWQLPAILVTGFPDQTVAIRALRAGIRDFVPKSPDYLDYLPTAVDRLVTEARVERKLVDSELRLASIIGTTMDAILMCDEQRRIVLFNKSAEEMFACSAAEATTRYVDEFIPGLVLADETRNTEEAAGTVRKRAEFDAIRADGGSIPIEVSVSDVVVHERRLFTVIARDVSERRRIEAELREADRRKDEFLGMLAHELRNPLAAIMGAGEVLHQIAQGPHAQKLTAVVTRQTRALARMVGDLLDVSRVTLGKIRLTTEPIVLSQVVSRAADNLRESVAKSGLEFEVRVDQEPVWLHGDPTRLEQVLANLVGNAVKFTPPGGRITITAGREVNQAVIRVRDTGLGMDPALVPKVFDLFVQGDTSLARSKSGLGIGLALVRQLVSLHGGQVSAFSAGPGKGSEFLVRLPTAPVENEAIEEDDEEALMPAASRMRVLVVDDQPDVADAMALLMEALGHDAQTSYDATSALAQMRANLPDVMFVDIGMPGMNGYELAKHVRA
ncbi:MAG TPA: response regulator, partial [Vicinamibacterales bacterium]|nr:response regulator [Vicinamibacterales bacterium]